MADKLKQIPKKLLDWWNKFSPKQKTILVCALAGVILTVSIVAYVLTRPQYTLVANCETTKDASDATALLADNSITYKTSDDALSIYVLSGQASQARMVLGANDISTAVPQIDDVTSGGLSTTESDKQKRYIVYKQKMMEQDLQTIDVIDKAHVTFSIPENDGTLIQQNTDSSASVVLELNGELGSDKASAIAHMIATSLGNSSTDNVTIIDSLGNLLYSGETQAQGTGNASTQFAVKQDAENIVKQEVKSVLIGTNLYDNIEVASNLALDFSTYKTTEHNYSAPDGQTQGMLASEDTYNSEAVNGVAGTPGTTSNDQDGTYVIEDGSNSSETVTEESRKYLPDEKITEQNIPAGLIQYDSSSVSVTAKKLHIYKEEDIQSQGLLTNMTWDEYKAANGEQTKLTVDDDVYSIVSNATGIPTANIAIVAYDVPVFIDKEGSSIKATDIVQVILIIAILAVLAFVVIRSMRAQKADQQEEELAVESLLQSTPQEDLEDIELESKSEECKLIEKLVDENPEAVANLLRNWLTEDWG